MKKSPLVNQPQDLGFGHLKERDNEGGVGGGGGLGSDRTHRLFLPLGGPVVKDKLCDVTSALAGTEQILLRLPAYQNQS